MVRREPNRSVALVHPPWMELAFRGPEAPNQTNPFGFGYVAFGFGNGIEIEEKRNIERIEIDFASRFPPRPLEAKTQIMKKYHKKRKRGSKKNIFKNDLFW